MSGRPRALHVAPIMPARSGNGLAMRQGLFLEALARSFDVRLVLLPVAGRADAAPDLPSALGIPTIIIPTSGLEDTHFALLARLADPAARLEAFRRYGRSSLAAGVSAAVLAELRAALGGAAFDLIHIGRSYLADALSATAGAPLVTMDLDEDEATSSREIADGWRDHNPYRAAWAEAEADALAAGIARTAPSVHRHFISSEADAAAIGRRHPSLSVEVVENAIALPPATPRADDGRTLLFLASYGYAPNVEAVAWFMDAVWPRVRRECKGEVRLRLAGRDAGRLETWRGVDGVEIVGEVADVAGVYAEASVFVAPLRAGAGTRLKLLEAAAHGVPIVTTGIGARGLPFVSGQHALIADAPADLARAIAEALADPAAGARRAAAARALVAERFDRNRAMPLLACRLSRLASR